MILLGELYVDGFEGSSTDLSKAKFYFEKAAELSDSEAMFNLGAIYSKESTENSLSNAVSWYQKAVDLNNSKAMANLGILYAKGEGVEVNNRKAFELVCKSAQLGDALGLANLGTAINYGVGIQANERIGFQVNYLGKFLHAEEQSLKSKLKFEADESSELKVLQETVKEHFNSYMAKLNVSSCD